MITTGRRELNTGKNMLQRRRGIPAGIAFSLLLAVIWSPQPPAAASDATQQLQSAVHRLTARLGSGEKSDGWRRYLKLNVLETQSAKGELADIATLYTLQQRFASGAEGLNHPVFHDVRVALENQISNLNAAANIGELNQAVAMARGQFQPITIDAMRYYRDLAKKELEALRIYYRQEYSSYDRANAFYDMNLDEALVVLDQIEFELAPEVSVGKMNSMIRDVQKQRSEIIKKIDALPFKDDSEPEDESTSPAPDDTVSLSDLKQQRQQLEERIKELGQQRNEIRKQDAPRAKARAETFRQLLEFENGFKDAAKDHGDPYFVSTQLAFERFVRSYFYGTADNLQEDYLVRIERLAEELPKLDDPTERLAAGNVGNILEWLENAYQVPYLVTAIRARYSLPNIYVSVSSELLNQIGGQSACQTRPVRENVKGRLVRGSATSRSQVTFDLVDDPNQVHVSILAHADINSKTYIQQRKLFAYIDAAGQAEARRSLYFNVGGLLADQPYAAANMNTFFRGTSSHCGLIDRFAEKKFEEGKAESEVGATNRVRSELMERFASETAEPVAKGKQALADAKSKSNNKTNYIPEIYAHSHSNRVFVVGKKSSKSTLGSSNYPVQFGGSSQVEVRLHDSVMSNYVEPIFSGKTFTNDELAKELESLLGKKPDSLNPDSNDGETENDEPFSITFANVRPIQFEFEDNMFTVVVTGRRFSQGDNQIRAGLKIKLRFRFSRTGGKLQMVRDGKAEIDYVDRESKDAKIVAFRSFLDGRLNPKEGVEPTKVDLPDNLIPVDKIEALKDRPEVRNMLLSQCRIEGGWFYLGWNYSPAGSYSSFPVDLPAIWTETIIDQMDSIYTPTAYQVPHIRSDAYNYNRSIAR